MTDTAYEVKVRPEKAAEVERIRDELDGSQAAVITEYRGLTVTALATLRERLLATETTYRVTKNTLTRRAAVELGLAELEELLVGPVAIAYVKGDAVAAAKIISTFAKEHPELVIKGGVLEGRIISGTEAKDLANVDPIDVSRAKIAGMLTAPLRQIAMLLEAPASRIAYVLQELGKREGGAPEAEAAAPEAEAAAPEAEASAEAVAEAPAEGDVAPEEPAPEQPTELSSTAAAADEPVTTEESPADAAPEGTATEEPGEGSTEQGAE
jgi:large subunit ribosomal protein L10